MSKVLQNALLEHSAILSTFIKPPFNLRPLFCLFLGGRLRQAVLYLRACEDDRVKHIRQKMSEYQPWMSCCSFREREDAGTKHC